MKPIYAALTFMLLLAEARAQGTNSLDALIETALANNPEITVAHRKWDAAKQKAPQARALDDPMIGVDVERSGTTQFGTYNDSEWMISQRLPWFGKRGAKASVAELEAEVVGFKYLEQTRTIRARVIAAYWDLWLAQKSVEIAGANKTLLEQFEQITRVRYETGQGMQADLLRAQVELAKMVNEVITMEREVPVAQAVVNKLLNSDPNTPRQAEGPVYIPPLEVTLEKMQEQARKYCCVLISFLRMVQAKKIAVRAARLEQRPEFEFRVEARQFNGRSGIQEYDTGVFINFPWLWRGKYKAMVTEARADKEIAEAELQSEINMTLLDVKELHTKADASLRLMKLYEEKVIPQARQLVEVTRAAYTTGKASFLELVEAQRALRDAELDYARAQADQGKTRAKLDAVIAPWGPREFATGLVTPGME